MSGKHQGGARRACVFCGAKDRKISKEHVFPKWLRRFIEGGEEGQVRRSRIHSTSDGEIVRAESWPEAPIDWQVAAPCQECNQGWMEEIEREARPVLVPMLKDERAALGPVEQNTLARWITLRLMMAQHAYPAERRRAIRPEQYERFYSARELPPATQTWMARYSGAGPWPTNYTHREMFIATDTSGEPNAYITGFSVGYVAFVVWGHYVADGATVHLGEGMRPYLTPIWPALDEAFWPPPGLLGAYGLETVVQNLVRSA